MSPFQTPMTMSPQDCWVNNVVFSGFAQLKVYWYTFMKQVFQEGYTINTMAAVCHQSLPQEIVTPSLPHCIFEDHVAVLQFEILYIYKLGDHMMIKTRRKCPPGT